VERSMNRCGAKAMMTRAFWKMICNKEFAV
jgi:hypothetical protein